MKKVGIVLVLLLILGVGVFGIYRWISSTTPDDGKAQQKEINYLMNEVDLSILLYGEGLEFPKGLEYTIIDSLESKNWQLENDYIYLIINDLESSTNFTKEDLTELVAYANNNTNFNFYYIGTDKLPMIDEMVEDSNIGESDMSFGYVMNGGDRIVHLGVWSQNDHQYLDVNPELLSENVYAAVLMNVKSNE